MNNKNNNPNNIDNNNNNNTPVEVCRRQDHGLVGLRELRRAGGLEHLNQMLLFFSGSGCQPFCARVREKVAKPKTVPEAETERLRPFCRGSTNGRKG